MKKLLLTVTLCLACAAAFGQGKVRLVNDSLHLVYWDPVSGGTNAGGVYSLGQGGITLTIELWSGTSSTSLSRTAVTDFNGAPGVGVWNGMNVLLPTAAGATFFQIDVYDAAAGSYQVASTVLPWFSATSGLFTANASSTIAYNSLVQLGPPASSTFAIGGYNMDSLAPGYRGAFDLHQVPEPTTIALAGLAGAALMIMRRRK